MAHSKLNAAGYTGKKKKNDLSTKAEKSFKKKLK